MANLWAIHTNSEAGLTTGGLAEDLSAAAAEDNRLGVRENSGDGEAARALDVHEERVRVLDQTLQLVALLLLLGRGVNEINGKRLSSVSMLFRTTPQQYVPY
mgnify:CR=1 FL=1